MPLSDLYGKVCPYCKTVFVPGDEIVVCSECDMPHHKNCWVENRGCTTVGCQGTIQNPGEGLTSVTATQMQYEPRQIPGVVYCTRCGAPNSENFRFCSACGAPRAAAARSAGTGDNLMAALVGAKQEYYLPAFARMCATGRIESWNWCAFLFTPYWLIYRKMYSYGAAALAVGFLSNLTGNTLVRLLSLAVCAFAGVYGNTVYLRRLERLRSQTQYMSPQEQGWFLAQNGGVNQTAAILAAVGMAILSSVLVK